MRKIKVYISFPMKGYRVEDYTAKSKEAEERLERLGFETVTPLNNGLPTEAPVSEHMKADYKMLLGCDAIFLCGGWEYSHGCMNELQVAADCRLLVLNHSMSDEMLFYLRKQREERI